MTTQKWRFPDNNYTSENGLDTSDMEMFKKDPVSSLAKQNNQTTTSNFPCNFNFTVSNMNRFN